MVVVEVVLCWRLEVPGGVEVGAVEDKTNLEVFTVTVGDDDFRQETEERLGESQQDNGGDPHLSPGTRLRTTNNIRDQRYLSKLDRQISVQTELISIYSSITDRDGDCYQTDQHTRSGQ